MSLKSIVAATITLVKDHELRIHQEALEQLSKAGFPTFITDGGSGDHFLSFLKSFPNFTLHQTHRPGVFVQAKTSLQQAHHQEAPYILYTEPDKKLFFEYQLNEFLRLAPIKENVGIVIPSRTAQSFATFPASQQKTEVFTNDLCGQMVGLKCDFCYGPLLIKRELLNYLDLLDESIGWGWRFFMFGLAHRLGLPIVKIELDLPCPLEQREDSKAELLHRMNQLHQNVRGMVLSASAVISQRGEDK